MKSRERIEMFIKEYPENELFFANSLYQVKLSKEINEAAYYQMLSRMCKEGSITRIAKGIYCRRKVTKFGIIPPSEKEIVRSFTENNKGVIVGYSLYNTSKLTTQIPKNIFAYSSLLKEQHRQIGNVILQKCNMEFSPEVCSVVRILDILQHYREIQELKLERFLNICSEFAAQYNDDTANYVLTNLHYSKRTIAFLREVLDYHGKPHTLDRYLSPLSDYKIPNMKGFYETSRKPN